MARDLTEPREWTGHDTERAALHRVGLNDLRPLDALDGPTCTAVIRQLRMWRKAPLRMAVLALDVDGIWGVMGRSLWLEPGLSDREALESILVALGGDEPPADATADQIAEAIERSTRGLGVRHG